MALKPFDGEFDPLPDAAPRVKPYDGDFEPLAGTTPRDRSLGEVVTDTAKSVGAGIGGLTKAAGDLYGVVTGDYDNAVSRTGADMRDFYRKSQSQPLQQRRATRDLRIDQADGVLAKAGTAIKETVTDPALLIDTLAENVPTLVPSAAAGRAAAAITGARTLGAQAAKGASREIAEQAAARAAGRVGTAAAVGTAGAQQGVDVAAGVYEQSMAQDDATWASNSDFVARIRAGDSPEEAKHALSLAAARTALPGAAALSVASQAIPGGTMLERALVGGAARRTLSSGGILQRTLGVGRGMAGEGTQEAIEEGGGQFIGNVARQAYVDPNADLTEGVGEGAGMGFAAGAGLGGIAGGVQGVRGLDAPADTRTDVDRIADTLRARVERASSPEEREFAQAELAGYLERSGRLIARDPIVVAEDGQAMTGPQAREVAVSEQGLQRDLGLTPDVRAAQAQNPAFTRTLPNGAPLPNPASGPLSRVVNIAADTGALDAAAQAQARDAALQQIEGAGQPADKAKAPQRIDPATGQLGAEWSPEQIRSYLDAQAARGPLPKPALIAEAFGLKLRAAAELRRQVTIDARLRADREELDAATNRSETATDVLPGRTELERTDLAGALDAGGSGSAVAGLQGGVDVDAGAQQRDGAAAVVEPAAQLGEGTDARGEDAGSLSGSDAIAVQQQAGEPASTMRGGSLDPARQSAEPIESETATAPAMVPVGMQPVAESAEPPTATTAGQTNRMGAEPDLALDGGASSQVTPGTSTVQSAAAEAATSPTNELPDATPAQREAGNFKVGRMKFAGLDVSIEYPAGVKRKPDHQPLTRPYGYFRGTVGRDKDHVDVFLGDRAEDASLPVFVIDQVGADGKFDEHKVVVGEPDEASARAAYLSNYPANWTGMGGITQMSQEQFKTWVNDKQATKRPAAVWMKSANIPDVTSAAKIMSRIQKAARDAGGVIYARWSKGPRYDLRKGSRSRDKVSGQMHGGLSAVPIEADMTQLQMVRRLKEYGFLRLNDSTVSLHLYAGSEVGRDSDGYASIQPTQHLLEVDQDFIQALDRGYAVALEAQEELADAQARLERTNDPMGREIIQRTIESARRRLDALPDFSKPPAPLKAGPAVSVGPVTAAPADAGNNTKRRLSHAAAAPPAASRPASNNEAILTEFVGAITAQLASGKSGRVPFPAAFNHVTEVESARNAVRQAFEQAGGQNRGGRFGVRIPLTGGVLSLGNTSNSMWADIEAAETQQRPDPGTTATPPSEKSEAKVTAAATSTTRSDKAKPKISQAKGRVRYVENAAATLAAYFEPGAIVESYGGRDRVISFTPATGDRGWEVEVQAIGTDGQPAPNERVRRHTTTPSQAELVKALGKPQERLRAAAEAKRATPAKAAAAPRQRAQKTDTASKPMDLLRVIAANGGLNREAFRAEGVDPADFTRRAGFQFIFRKQGGMTLSDLREFMQQEGYLPRDPEDGRPVVDDNDALDLFDRAFRGGALIYADDQAEAVAAYQAQQQDADAEFQTDLKPIAQTDDQAEAAFRATQNAAIAGLTERAYDLGATDAEIVGAAFDAANDEQHRQALESIVTRLSRDAIQPRPTDDPRERRAEAGEEAQPAAEFALDAPAAEESGEVVRSSPPQGGLFAAPTTRDRVAAAQRDRDDARDGRAGAGRTDMAVGDGELFAGDHPDQTQFSRADRSLTGALSGLKAGRGHQPLPLADARNVATAALAKWKAAPKLTVVDTEPEGVPRGVEGYFDSATGGITIIAPNVRGGYDPVLKRELSTTERIRMVVMHEAIGHAGVEAITGPETWSQLEQTVDRMRASGKHVDLFRSVDRRYPGLNRLNPRDRAEATREAIAIMVEKGMRNSVVDRVIAAVRRFIRQTLGLNIAITEAELRQHVLAAARYVQQGVAPAGAPTAGAASAGAFASRPELDLQREVPVTKLLPGMFGDTTTKERGRIARRRALAYLNRVRKAGITFTNSDTGWKIGLSNTSAREIVSWSADPAVIQMIAALPRISKTAVLARSEKNNEIVTTGDAVRNYHTFYAPVAIGTELRIARIVVREHVNGNFAYDLQASEVLENANPAVEAGSEGEAATRFPAPKAGARQGLPTALTVAQIREAVNAVDRPGWRMSRPDPRLVVDARGNRAIELAGERFAERSGRFYLTNGTGEPKDFRTLSAAQALAERTGGEVLVDEPVEGEGPSWSVVVPDVVAREAAASRRLFSRPDPAAEGVTVFGRARGYADKIGAKNRTPLPSRFDDAQRVAAEKFATFERGESLSLRYDRLKANAAARFTQKVIDQFRPLRGLNEEAFMQAHLSKGTDGALEAAFLYGMPKLHQGAFTVTERAGGFRKVMADLKGEHDQFLMWVVGHRAESLKLEGREHLFTDDDIIAMKRLNLGKMEDGSSRAAAYSKALGELNRYNRAFLDIAQEAGLIDAEARKVWEDGFYIPFYRAMEEDPAAGPGQVKGLLRQRVIERLTGGTEPLGDPLENILANWSQMLTASMKNMAANKALDAAVPMKVASRVEGPGKGVVWTMRQGKESYFIIKDPMVLEALESLSFNGYDNPLMRAAGKFKRVLTTGVTINPSFRIRNMARDVLSAMATSDVSFNPVRNIVDGLRATAPGTDTNVAMMAGGGAIRFGTINDGDQAGHAKRLISMGVQENQILDTQDKVKNAFRRFYDWWQQVGDRAETVNRALIYERAIAAGQSNLAANFAARDLMNFTSMGSASAIRAMSQVLPFFNARLQGTDRLIRGAKADPRRFTAVAGTLAMASALLYLLNHDDEDYRNLPDFVRDNYWPIKLGGKWVYIPKPFEIGAMATIVERGTELAISGEDYKAKDFATTVTALLSGQLAMNPVPQIARPMTEAAFNYDMFRMAPIDSVGQQNLAPEDRFTARTAAGAVAAGKITNVSPQRIEHLVSGYFGWLGVQALNVSDYLMRDAMGLPSNPRRDLSTPTNLFVVGDFVKEPTASGSKYVTRFYESQRVIDQIYASANNARKTGDPERDAELRAAPTLALRPLYRRADTQITRLNQQIKAISNRRDMDAAEKTRRIENLNQRRAEIARRVDERARRFESTGT